MRDILLCHKELRRERVAGTWVYLGPETALDDVLAAIEGPGEPLKAGAKSPVWRYGHWVVKRSGGGVAGTVKRTVQRERYRRAWLAAHHLDLHGVNVPRPVAFVEWRRAGVISAQAMVSEYLDEHRNVEDFTRALLQRGAGKDTLTHFFTALGAAVRQLEAAGAFHADLSGKNIFTRDGARFVFIDLDAVALGGPYTEARRLKNHVQLYDSFCDHLNDRVLVPFITSLLPEAIDARAWMPRVREGQAARRARYLARRK